MNVPGSKLLLTVVLFPFAASAEPAVPVPTSSFSREKIDRNPFERIDAKTMLENRNVVLAAGGEQDDLKSQFNVSGILIDRLAIAIINRKAFAEGETFRLQFKQKQLSVKVAKVNAESVDLICDNLPITVPISRQMPKLMLEE